MSRRKVSSTYRRFLCRARRVDEAAAAGVAEFWIVRSFARRAWRKAALAVRLLSRRGSPAAVRGDTRVVSTATWTPPQSGKPFAMTSMRRSSCRQGVTLRSRTKTLVATVAPASRQTRAAARSRGDTSGAQHTGTGACSEVIPELVLATTAAAESGKGSRRRRNSKARKCEGASESSGEVGLAVSLPASPAGRQQGDQARGGWSGSRTRRRPWMQGVAIHGWCRAGVLHPHRQGAEQGSSTARAKEEGQTHTPSRKHERGGATVALLEPANPPQECRRVHAQKQDPERL